jgi:hypothetical protein
VLFYLFTVYVKNVQHVWGVKYIAQQTRYTMKRLLLSISIFLLVGQSLSQSNRVGDYEPIFSEDNIVMSIAEGIYNNDGKNHVRYYIKYENYTNFPVELSFQKELHYGDDCYGCNDNDEQNFTLTIPANSTLVFNDENRSKTFYIFVKDQEGWIKRQLTDFDIKNIKLVQL